MEYICPRLVPRYSFCVDIDLTDLRSEIQIRGRTKDVCLFGCSVDALRPFAKGTMVRMMLSRGLVCVAALGRVVYACKESGMGIAITNIERGDERILEDWIVELMAIRV
jgi:hypothetical protein